MNLNLKNDLLHFCNVFENNLSDALGKCLPPEQAQAAIQELREELELLRESIELRVNEEFMP